MSRYFRSLAVLCLLLPSLASATLLNFVPSNADIDLGDSIAVDIVATPEAGELIGAFDFIVNFDPAILAFDTLTFGPSLNDDDLFCTLLGCRGFSSAGGQVSLFEASLVFPLTTLQDGASPITLATLVFDAIGVGTSDLTFTGNVLGQAAPFNLLGDDFGIPLAVFEPGTGRITVAQPVAEPPVLLLMVAGLLALAARRRQPA